MANNRTWVQLVDGYCMYFFLCFISRAVKYYYYYIHVNWEMSNCRDGDGLCFFLHRFISCTSFSENAQIRPEDRLINYVNNGCDSRPFSTASVPLHTISPFCVEFNYFPWPSHTACTCRPTLFAATAATALL